MIRELFKRIILAEAELIKQAKKNGNVGGYQITFDPIDMDELEREIALTTPLLKVFGFIPDGTTESGDNSTQWFTYKKKYHILVHNKDLVIRFI